MESKVFFTFYRTFLLFVTMSLRNFIESNFDWQYLSDLGFLIPKNLPLALKAITTFVIPASIY
jgi:hypothetical protein